MGKKAKEHRRKVQLRNNKIKEEKSRIDKFRKEFIMNMIKQEQEKGMFNNNPSIPSVDGPSLNIDGPSI